MNKIIAFSLYGNHPMYHKGAIENARLQPKIYPGWRCRFYVSQEIPSTLIDQLERIGAEVIYKERKWNSDGMFWRFLPAADADVDVLIVRDADSRLSKRESLAVHEWLQSDKSFHIMRDHPQHGWLILGGMWGCRGNILRELPALLERWQMQHPRLWQQSPKGLDQLFLGWVVYPRIRQDVFIHSEFIRYGREKVHPFPLSRVGGEFVGQVIDNPMTDKGVSALTLYLENTRLKTYRLPYYIYLYFTLFIFLEISTVMRRIKE